MLFIYDGLLKITEDDLKNISKKELINKLSKKFEEIYLINKNNIAVSLFLNKTFNY